MKNLILFLVLGLAVFSVSGQDFTGQHNGYVHFYKADASGKTYLLRCDSTAAAGADSIYWLRKGIRAAELTGINNGICPGSDLHPDDSVYCHMFRDIPTLLGPHIRASDRYVQYYNHNGEPITIDMHMATGDSTIILKMRLKESG